MNEEILSILSYKNMDKAKDFLSPKIFWAALNI